MKQFLYAIAAFSIAIATAPQDGHAQINISTARAPDSEFPPVPKDPKLAAALSEARALLERSRAKGFLDAPDTTKPWPCSVSELQLRKLAGALSSREMEQDPALKSLFDNQIRTIHGVRHAPVLAQCKNGKLDGPLEFVMDYTRVSVFPNRAFEGDYRVRVQVTMSSGNLVLDAPQSRVLIPTSPGKATYNSAEEQARADKFGASRPVRFTLSVTYSQTSFPLSDESDYSAQITETIELPSGVRDWVTRLHVPREAEHGIQNIYRGARLSNTYHTKGGKTEGESIEYPYTSSDGVEHSGRIRCWKDGEILETTTCPGPAVDQIYAAARAKLAPDEATRKASIEKPEADRKAASAAIDKESADLRKGTASPKATPLPTPGRTAQPTPTNARNQPPENEVWSWTMVQKRKSDHRCLTPPCPDDGQTFGPYEYPQPPTSSTSMPPPPKTEAEANAMARRNGGTGVSNYHGCGTCDVGATITYDADSPIHTQSNTWTRVRSAGASPKAQTQASTAQRRAPAETGGKTAEAPARASSQDASAALAAAINTITEKMLAAIVAGNASEVVRLTAQLNELTNAARNSANTSTANAPVRPSQPEPRYGGDQPAPPPYGGYQPKPDASPSVGIICFAPHPAFHGLPAFPGVVPGPGEHCANDPGRPSSSGAAVLK